MLQEGNGAQCSIKEEPVMSIRVKPSLITDEWKVKVEGKIQENWHFT